MKNMINIMSHALKNIFFSCLLLVFIISTSNISNAGPTSSTYELKDYSFGSGGTTTGSSSNYNLLGIAGEQSGDKASSTNYKTGSGLVFAQQADVPSAPTFTNPDHYYNKLHLIINTSGNATDATYAIAISTDNFVSDTKYVQSDNTIGAVLGAEDWQTYTAWGSASGIDIIGLDPGITYTVKAEAEQGNFTQTGFGPTAQATTENPSLSFDIDVASTDTETAAPYSLSIGDLTAGSVITAPDKIWVDVDTNGTAGASVYVQDSNSGLNSTSASYTISALSGNLSSVSEGYGAQGASATQSSGGPLEIISPYDGASDVVGTLDTTKRIIFDSTAAPVIAGRASFQIKAKASAVTKAAGDYSDTLTLVASAAF